MARPTNDKKDTKIILRTNTETREYIENRAKEMGCSLSDCVRKIISDSEKAESVIPDKDYVIQTLETRGVSREVVEEMISIAGYFGMTLGEFLKEVNRLLNEGFIAGENGKLVVVMPEWAEEMKYVCDKHNRDINEAVNKSIELIKEGRF